MLDKLLEADNQNLDYSAAMGLADEKNENVCVYRHNKAKLVKVLD